MTKKLIIFLEIAVLAFLIYWHWKLGMTRLFDADEFAHLHWGYSLSIGEKPYTDFFYLFPPLFLYPIAAIFKIFGRTVDAILAGRMFIFLVFLSTSGILFLIAKKLRNVHFALLTVIVFAFLPIPFDKMIEVRPDMVATLLAMVGLLLFIEGYGGGGPFASPSILLRVNAQGKGDRGKQKKYFFLSGLLYAASLAVVPKTVFFLVPVGVVMVYRWLRGMQMSLRVRRLTDEAISKNYKDRHAPTVLSGLAMTNFFLGFVPVGLLLFFLLLSYGNIEFSIYSVTRMASEVTKVLGSKFYMRPDIFFYPNDLFYGIAGWSMPLWVNLFIWVSASIWGIHKLLSLGSSTVGGVMASQARPATPEVSLSRREFLVAGTFWVNLTAFVFFYPLKHSQYLIPVAPFIAFYFVDLWGAVGNKLPRLPRSLRWGMTMILLLFFSVVAFQMNQKKLQWGNKPTVDKLNNYLKTIPKNEAVYDLTGESIFYRNGYYFCCLPYGQYEEALYFKIPDIEKEMERRGTKYVHLGWQKRLEEIPAGHAKYINENFVPTSGDGLLWERKPKVSS